MTGTLCRWISSFAKHCGCDAIMGNARKLLVNAANYILRESSKDSSLKRYGERPGGSVLG